MLHDGRSFHGVPIEGLAVNRHVAMGLIKGPVEPPANDNMAVARQAGHVNQAVHDDSRAGVAAIGGEREVARVKEIPLAIIVAERKGVDGEAVAFAIGQDNAAVGEGAGGGGVGGDANGKPLRLESAHGVIEIIEAVVARDFRRPILMARVWNRRDQGAAEVFPMHQVGRTQQGKDASIGGASGAGGAISVIIGAKAHDGRVRHGAGINGVGVGGIGGRAWRKGQAQEGNGAKARNKGGWSHGQFFLRTRVSAGGDLRCRIKWRRGRAPGAGRRGSSLAARGEVKIYYAMKLHRRTTAALVLVCLLGLAAGRCLAQGADGEAWRSFQSRQWLKEDGLPDNFVTTLLQTHDKYLWVGTMSGLVRFAGAHFQPELPMAGDTNQTAPIAALYEDRANQLWVGTTGHGLYVHTANGFAPFAAAGAALPVNINCLAQDAAGDFWIGTDEGLARMREGRVKIFTKADGLPDDFVSAVHAARSGTLWVTTRAGMCEMRGDRPFPMELQTQGLGRNPEFLGIYEDRQTNLWAFGDTFLVNLKDGKRFNYFRNGDLASFRIWSLCEGRNGQLWIGTSGQGVFSFAHGRFAPVSFRERLVSSDVRAICEDDQGDVWLGSLGGGLIRMQRRSWDVIGAGAGLPDEPPSSLAIGANGQLWAGFLRDGLYRTTVDRAEAAGLAGLNGAEPMTASLAAGADGSIWMGSYGQGVFHLQAGKIEQFTSADGLSDNVIPALCVDAAGAVWIGCRSGVIHKISEGRIGPPQAPDGGSGAAITCLTPAAGRGLWVGTGDGRAWRAEDGRFTSLLLPEALQGKSIRALFEDRRGRLWIGANDVGLACLSENKAALFGAARGFPDTDVDGITEDAEGNLWIRANRGLWRVPRNAMAELPPGNLRAEEVFAESPGLAGLEIPSAPGAVRGADGTLYFVSAHGILRVNPAAWHDSAPPFPVVLESVTASDNTGVIARWANDPDLPPQTLPPRARSLEFHFTAVDLASPERVRFQHQLANFDADWVDGGPERFARYGRLAPGSYEFRVRASQGDGGWREAPNAFAFQVAGSPWAAPWAVICDVLLGAALVAAAVRVISHRRLRRNLALLAQQQAMEKERMRIAQNMHDEIGSKLTRISFLSEIALRGQEPATDNLQSIAATSQQLLQTLDEIVWAVNPQNDTLEHLAAYLGHYADEYFQNTGIELELQIAQGLPHRPLSSETRHNLFLAFEEALGNVLKHSGAQRVHIDMRPTATHFVIKIRDEGRGFAVAGQNGRPETGRDGLVNIRQRLAQIGGECSIESAPAAGATVILMLPLPLEKAANL